MTKSILVIGSVTPADYDPYRISMLRRNLRPRIVRISTKLIEELKNTAEDLVLEGLRTSGDEIARQDRFHRAEEELFVVPDERLGDPAEHFFDEANVLYDPDYSGPEDSGRFKHLDRLLAEQIRSALSGKSAVKVVLMDDKVGRNFFTEFGASFSTKVSEVIEELCPDAPRSVV